MRKSIALITAPTSEPVTLAEVKAWARIDSTDEDALINSLIISARQEVEKYLKRALITQTLELTLDMIKSAADNFIGDGTYDIAITELYSGLPREITLPYAPIQSITSVTTYDLSNTSAVYSSANYTLDIAGSRFVLNYGAIWTTNLRYSASVKIRYLAGYGTAANVPQAIKIAIMSYVQDIYESRGVCDIKSDPIANMHERLFSFRNMIRE